ncbi:M13 family metallopeptidase [Sphingomonas tabacisoli]|uniref:M13 family metallopeptidase n=1 Tax=Sphingomonas tabacisoli TaxID=2249466 RepID=A0ABW4I4G9_9SPHN
MKIIACAALLASGTALAGPLYPPFGLDLTAPDKSVRPGDDFFEYANGAYLARTSIPADRPTASRRLEMTDRMEANLHVLLENAAKALPGTAATETEKVGAFYAAFMDEAQADRLGATPLKPELDAIRAAPDRPALAQLMGDAPRGLYPSLFAMSIDSDLKDPSRYAVYLGQSGLGLPDRDYYLKPELAAKKDAYRVYAAQLLELARWPDPAKAADAVVAFETRIAEASWTKVQQRDPTTQYNPIAPSALPGFAPGFDWAPFLDRAGVAGKPTLIVAEKSAFPKLAALYAETPVETLKAWMAFRIADTAAPYLSKPFVDAHFNFRLKALTGQAEQQPRWKRGIRAVAGGDCGVDATSCFGTLNWAVGELYARRYFPPETKAKVAALVDNVKLAMRGRIERLAWMGPQTKAEALKKLDTYTIKVGYPDKPQRDYASVVIRRDDLLGNVRRAAANDWAFALNRSAGSVDRGAWLMTPQTNDAYNGSLRDIVFPAGILQAPIFDADADPAINYGGIGGVIGHELTHGFDDQGRSIDASGALRDWWTPADAAAFKARAKLLGDQYATYEPVPGFHINPGLTMGENIADLGGLAIALDAYHASLKGRPAPVIGGLTGDQRVFLGWAQAWAGKTLPDAIKQLTVSDPHSFRKFRVNGPVRNIDAWYSAFGVKPGDKLYLDPKVRARIW